MCRVLAFCFLQPFTVRAPSFYVRCGFIGSPVFSFSLDWGGGASPLALCNLLLLSVLDRLFLV